MLTQERREKRNTYMREYTRKNAASINASRVLMSKTPERKALKVVRDKAYYERSKEKRETPEFRAANLVNCMRWQKANPEKVLSAKRIYRASDLGKLQKAKDEVKYQLSGGRAATEVRRAKKPISEARKQSRRIYAIKRSSSEKSLDDLSLFVLDEAIRLCRMRRKETGIFWHVDHIIPVSKGGLSVFYNIQVVPAKWNQQKSNKTANKFFGAKGD